MVLAHTLPVQLTPCLYRSQGWLWLPCHVSFEHKHVSQKHWQVLFLLLHHVFQYDSPNLLLLLSLTSTAELLRVNAYQRPKTDLPSALEDVSTFDAQHGCFTLPPASSITAPRVRVVVATCVMAAKVGMSKTSISFGDGQLSVQLLLLRNIIIDIQVVTPISGLTCAGRTDTWHLVLLLALLHEHT